MRAALVALVVAALLLGPHAWLLWHREPNACAMTWMHPTYKAASVPNASRYRLYRYHEGAADPARLLGVPVLFVPGNAGSYRQVRSLGSEAARALAAGEAPDALDWWSVDLGEELSGASGALLQRHAHFVAACVAHLQRAYGRPSARPRRQRASGVLLVGHSMGGVVARVVAQREPWVRGVLTLATPHEPVALVDAAMAAVYAELELPRTFALASLGGGPRDALVPSRLARVGPAPLVHYADTLSLSRGPVSCDHLAIMWCNQVVRAVTRALLATLDARTGALAERASDVHAAMAAHLGDDDAAGRWTELQQQQPQQQLHALPRNLRTSSASSARARSGSASAEECVEFARPAREAVVLGASVARFLVRVLVWRDDEGGAWWDATAAAGLLDIAQGADERRCVGRLPAVQRVAVCVRAPALVHVCAEADCARHVRHLGLPALHATLHWESPSTEPAVLWAVNRVDHQSRLVSVVPNDASVSLRFDSSAPAAVLDVYAFFGPTAQRVALRVHVDALSATVDLSRPVLPLALGASLVWTCAAEAGLRRAVLATAAVMLTAGTLGWALLAARPVGLLYAVVLGYPVAELLRGLAALLVLRPLGVGRGPVLLGVAVAAAAVSYATGLMPLAAAVALLSAPSVGTTPFALMVALHVLPLDLVSAAAWLRVVQEEGMAHAASDAHWGALAWPAALLVPRLLGVPRLPGAVALLALGAAASCARESLHELACVVLVALLSVGS